MNLPQSKKDITIAAISAAIILGFCLMVSILLMSKGESKPKPEEATNYSYTESTNQAPEPIQVDVKPEPVAPEGYAVTRVNGGEKEFELWQTAEQEKEAKKLAEAEKEKSDREANILAAKIAYYESAMSARTYWQAFESNEVAAEAQYLDKQLLIKGTVISVEKRERYFSGIGMTDMIVIKLSGGPYSFQPVEAFMSNSKDVSNLTKGNSVVLSCVGAKKYFIDATVESCTVLPKPEPKLAPKVIKNNVPPSKEVSPFAPQKIPNEFAPSKKFPSADDYN